MEEKTGVTSAVLHDAVLSLLSKLVRVPDMPPKLPSICSLHAARRYRIRIDLQSETALRSTCPSAGDPVIYVQGDGGDRHADDWG